MSIVDTNNYASFYGIFFYLIFLPLTTLNFTLLCPEYQYFYISHQRRCIVFIISVCLYVRLSVRPPRYLKNCKRYQQKPKLSASLGRKYVPDHDLAKVGQGQIQQKQVAPCYSIGIFVNSELEYLNNRLSYSLDVYIKLQVLTSCFLWCVPKGHQQDV